MTSNGCSIAHQLAIAIVLLSIASQLSPGQAAAEEAPPGGMQLVLNELLGAAPENFLAQQLKYQQLKFRLQQQQQQQQQQQLQQLQQQPHLRAKPLPAVYFANQWPSLRDLVLGADYDSLLGMDSTEMEPQPQPELEPEHSHLLARLHRLSENAIDGEEPPQKHHAGGKPHSSKRNAQFRKQYMRPCHFKICNMGR